LVAIAVVSGAGALIAEESVTVSWTPAAGGETAGWITGDGPRAASSRLPQETAPSAAQANQSNAFRRSAEKDAGMMTPFYHHGFREVNQGAGLAGLAVVAFNPDDRGA